MTMPNGSAAKHADIAAPISHQEISSTDFAAMTQRILSILGNSKSEKQTQRRGQSSQLSEADILSLLPYNHEQLGKKLKAETDAQTITAQKLVNYALADAQLCHDILNTDTYQHILSAESILDIIYFYGSSAIASLSEIYIEKLANYTSKLFQEENKLGHHGYSHAYKFIPGYEPEDVLEHALEMLLSDNKSPKSVALSLYLVTKLIANKSKEDKEAALDKLAVNVELGPGYHYTCFHLYHEYKLSGKQERKLQHHTMAIRSGHPQAITIFIAETLQSLPDLHSKIRSNLSNETTLTISDTMFDKARLVQILEKYTDLCIAIGNESSTNPSLNPALAIHLFAIIFSYFDAPIADDHMATIVKTLESFHLHNTSKDSQQNSHSSQLAPAYYAYFVYHIYMTLYESHKSHKTHEQNKVYRHSGMYALAYVFEVCDKASLGTLLQWADTLGIEKPSEEILTKLADKLLQHKAKLLCLQTRKKLAPSEVNTFAVDFHKLEEKISIQRYYKEFSIGNMEHYDDFVATYSYLVPPKDILQNILPLIEALPLEEQVIFIGYFKLFSIYRETASAEDLGKLLYHAARLGSLQPLFSDFNIPAWAELRHSLWKLCETYRPKTTGKTHEVLATLTRQLIRISNKDSANSDKKHGLLPHIITAYQQVPTAAQANSDNAKEISIVNQLAQLLESHYYAFSAPEKLKTSFHYRNVVPMREGVTPSKPRESSENLTKYLECALTAAEFWDNKQSLTSMVQKLIGRNIDIHLHFDSLRQMSAHAEQVELLLLALTNKEVQTVKETLENIVNNDKYPPLLKGQTLAQSIIDVIRDIIPKLTDIQAPISQQSTSAVAPRVAELREQKRGGKRLSLGNT